MFNQISTKPISPLQDQAHKANLMDFNTQTNQELAQAHGTSDHTKPLPTVTLKIEILSDKEPGTNVSYFITFQVRCVLSTNTVNNFGSLERDHYLGMQDDATAPGTIDLLSTETVESGSTYVWIA